ncbi:Na+/H+ antiporter NhaC family protein [Romboutsia sp. 1001216sp1]|uniref:Na+/H+ antiporter NhaC family protein n=1 Tax=unclassified Romboutsia TaxID=2626894 RepID=UPI00189D1B64|nr:MULTISPECIES: Na+/H+ antiporter NhaC family protein [unclassified Romboutsia]MDB8791804.1 Na+/H+ antiporter NhaC family protein [Romboutsia sp. 1001216sp1]MDB8793610.1 Na+/H+ antiporter NhaC family protein [Romboutsia sp. 1001216sp1]MDB8795007.1 Na+/H+ antiporter NhaC family protein [Romboutsia sp. 1001216sp1]MDB8798818.1 Na+/H+ antiporter NhaC family protein [Romboutsia sp. 1001216sp1]MDB8801620.1 Na+/H+ antiporter NhaC family protein [Romboutsia sp. 1001216sp1]
MRSKRNFRVLLMTIIIFMMSMPLVFAGGDDISTINSERLKMITLIPPLVAIVLAFITKNVVISLFVGIFSGSFIINMSSGNVIVAFVNAFLDIVNRALNSLADPWNAGIILQVLAIGGVISLVARMGGAKAIAESLAKRSKTARGTQLIAWFLGLLVFFDDYANSLIVGPIVRPVADKMKLSREKLAFIIDATAAPIAGLAIISTWIGLEVGLINDAFNGIGVEADAFGVFLNTIPYRFYNILILAFIVISAVLAKDFGPMREAQIKARSVNKNNNNSNNVSNDNSDLEPKEGIKLSSWNAIIPIGTLIIAALISFYYSGYTAAMNSDNQNLIQLFTNSPYSFDAIREAFSGADASVALFQSALFASIVGIVLGVSKNILTISEAIDAWIDGMKGLIMTGVILILAWSLSSVIKELGTAKYLVTLLSGTLPNFLLPSVVFILGAIISFATGTAYGTMGILMPLAIPLAHSINPEMSFIVVSTSAVLTGAIFGDHCSPISDTTIMSSMGAGCNHIDHVNTQMPYALFTAVITVLFGYIPAGLGIPVYIVLPIALLATFIGIHVLGKKTYEEVDNIIYTMD